MAPYLSWHEGEHLRRHRLEEECVLGRDPLACGVALPEDPSLSRQHAALFLEGDQWWIRDLGSTNGTLLNGLPAASPFGSRLEDGDIIRVGDRDLRFTHGFPGLDGVNFIEGVGDLFAEVRPEPSQAALLVRGMELLLGSTQIMLQETRSGAMFRSLVSEAMRILGADRGFVVNLNPDGSWTSVHREGDVEDRIGLSRSVLAYVSQHRIAVASNAPMIDPRFGGSSLVEFHRGALMCAPMEFDGQVQGMLYVDRQDDERAFTRFDLSLFMAFVRQGTLTLRHSHLAQKALGQAELHGELLRLKGLQSRTVKRFGEILAAMNTSLRWLNSFSAQLSAESGVAMRHQVERVQALVDAGLQETLLETPHETGHSTSLEALKTGLEASWRELLKVQGAELVLGAVPAGTVWMASHRSTLVLMSLVEPLLMKVPEGHRVHGRWEAEPGGWLLKLVFPGGLPAPTPDPWTSRTLQDVGIRWRWADHTLHVQLPEGPDHTPEGLGSAQLGLVPADTELLTLFQTVAEAGDLTLEPLEEAPPAPPQHGFRYIVIDALGVKDVLACIQAYRRHPSFLTTPILAVRVPDDLTHEILSAGATDWLPEGFKWEALHHRLQVLKGQAELQKKALASERLDSIRQMAGTLKHEINNPLAVISMQIEMLQRKYPEEPKLEKIEGMVERIRQLVQMLQKMREAASTDYADGSSILKLS